MAAMRQTAVAQSASLDVRSRHLIDLATTPSWLTMRSGSANVPGA